MACLVADARESLGTESGHAAYCVGEICQGTALGRAAAKNRAAAKKKEEQPVGVKRRCAVAGFPAHDVRPSQKPTDVPG